MHPVDVAGLSKITWRAKLSLMPRVWWTSYICSCVHRPAYCHVSFWYPNRTNGSTRYVRYVVTRVRVVKF
ncbi:unnamed protein product [Linum tenue]|uniref:Uncharacterized protein n=1 Tax=Linum tenue TaxID=586396 RepID=A0AAV0QWH2_9ROSI|nr:unnamed protein product [Linum tenue]